MFADAAEFESNVLAGMGGAQSPRTSSNLMAAQVAQAYEQYVKNLWGGEPTAPAFCTWLAPFWRSTLPPVPTAMPDAVSPHAAGGRGIRWYDTARGVVGYVAGMKSGYQIPSNVSIPAPVGPPDLKD